MAIQIKYLIIILFSLSLSIGQTPVNIEKSLFEKEGVFYSKETKEPYSGKGFSIYKDGNFKIQGTLKDGKMVNRTEWKWYKNGQKWSEGNWENGKVNGLWTYWYENGQKNFEGTYKNGLKDGPWMSWYDNGQKFYEESYKNDKRDGTFKGWYQNGTQSSERTYSDGKVDGLETYWYISGQIYRELTYENGNLISDKKWNEDGSIKTD
jgi:antitoxin component YwqK of YwqJK toxin-antitoxin module